MATTCPGVASRVVSQAPTRSRSCATDSPPWGAQAGSASQASRASGSDCCKSSICAPHHRPKSQSRNASVTSTSLAYNPAVCRVRNSGAHRKRGAFLKKAAREPSADCLFISTGSFVGKRPNFCATVRAWHIKVKRVACTKNHSVKGVGARQKAVNDCLIVPYPAPTGAFRLRGFY